MRCEERGPPLHGCTLGRENGNSCWPDADFMLARPQTGQLTAVLEQRALHLVLAGRRSQVGCSASGSSSHDHLIFRRRTDPDQRQKRYTKACLTADFGIFRVGINGYARRVANRATRSISAILHYVAADQMVVRRHGRPGDPAAGRLPRLDFAHEARRAQNSMLGEVSSSTVPVIPSAPAPAHAMLVPRRRSPARLRASASV